MFTKASGCLLMPSLPFLGKKRQTARRKRQTKAEACLFLRTKKDPRNDPRVLSVGRVRSLL